MQQASTLSPFLSTLALLALREVMLIRLWPVLAVTSSLSTDAAMIAGTTNKKAKRDIYFTEYKREGYYNSIMKTDVKLSVIDAFVIRNNDKTVIKVETIMILSSVIGAVV